MRSALRRLERIAQRLPAPRLVCRAYFADGTPVFGGDPVDPPPQGRPVRPGARRGTDDGLVTFVCRLDESELCEQ